MAESIVTSLRTRLGQPHPVSDLRLVPSDGGRFEVTIDGELVYSKAATGQHVTNEEIIALIRQRMG